MRISRLTAPALLALTFAACSKTDDPTAPTPAQLRIEAAANLQNLSQKLSDPQSRAAVKEAGTMLNLGAPVTEITLTTAASAAISRQASVNTRVSADITNGTETWDATALQVVVANSNAGKNGTYNVLVMWKSDDDLVFVGAPNSQATSTIGTVANGAFGGLFTAPSSSWQATGGTATISNTSVSTTCAVTVSITGVTCKDAQFNAGFSITSSTPFTSSVGGANTATGSRTAALTTRSIPGIQVTVNCSIYNC